MLYFVVTATALTHCFMQLRNHAASIASSYLFIFPQMTPEKRQSDEMFIFDIQSLFLRRGNLSWQQDVEQW